MNKHTSRWMAMAALVMLAVSLVVLWSGCSRERGRVVEPEGTGLCERASALGQPDVPANVMAVYERLKSVTSPPEAEDITRDLSTEDQAALGELFRITQIDTVSTEAPATAPEGWEGPRTVYWTSRTYTAYGRNVFGELMWKFEVRIRWGYDGVVVYSPSATANGWALRWPWSYVPPPHVRVIDSTGWRAAYAEGQGRFHYGFIPSFPDQYPYMQPWMYGTGSSLLKLAWLYFWWVF